MEQEAMIEGYGGSTMAKQYTTKIVNVVVVIVVVHHGFQNNSQQFVSNFLRILIARHYNRFLC